MDHPTDIIGVDYLRKIDHHLLQRVHERAQLNNLTPKESEHLVREAVAAGRRCQDRLDRSARTVRSDLLNVAIQQSCHEYLAASAALLRREIATLFHGSAKVVQPAENAAHAPAAAYG